MFTQPSRLADPTVAPKACPFCTSLNVTTTSKAVTSRRTGAARRAARSGTRADCTTEGTRRTAASRSPFCTQQLTTRTRSMTTTDGTIKRMTDRGFGFIATAEGTEYFPSVGLRGHALRRSTGRASGLIYRRARSERSPRRERPTGVVASIPVSLMAPFAAPSQETAARAMVRSRTAEARCCRTNP